MVTAFRAVQGAEAWAADGGWVTAHSGVLGPGIAQRVADGAAMTVEQLSGARAVVAEGPHGPGHAAPRGHRRLAARSQLDRPPLAASPERKTD